MRLFTFERRVVGQQLLTCVFGGLERVVVRLQKHRRQHGWTCPQPSPSLCVDDRGGKRSALVSGDDEDEGEAHPHLSQPLLFQLSNTATVVESTVECKCFSAQNRNCFSLSHGTVLHSSCVSAGDSLARAACRGRLPCSREAQCGSPTGDGAEATCRAEKARREAELGRVVHTGLVRLGGHAREPPQNLPQAKRPGWWRRGMSLFGGRSAPTDGAEMEAGITTSHHEIYGSGWWTTLLCHLQGWDNRMIADHLAAWLPDVFRPWLSTRTLRRWMDENKKEGREPRGRRRDFRVFCAAHLQQSGRATWHDTQIRQMVDPPFPRCVVFKYRAASGGHKKTADPKLLDTHLTSSDCT